MRDEKYVGTVYAGQQLAMTPQAVAYHCRAGNLDARLWCGRWQIEIRSVNNMRLRMQARLHRSGPKVAR